MQKSISKSEGNVYSGRTKATDGHAKTPWWKIAAKTGGALVVAAVVFVAGIGVGNGSIRISSSGNPQNGSLPNHLDYATVDEAYRTLKANYDGKLTETQLLDGIKKGMAESTGDPYTSYFNAKDAKAFEDQLQGTFSGIGAELGKNDQGSLIIVSPIDGFPAQKAGLRAQDVIVSIDGKDVGDMAVDQAVTKIRGEKGTKVTLRVIRNKTQDLSFTIIRADIKIPSVKWEIKDNVGYMKINQFSSDTAELSQKAANEFKDTGVKGVILDLRGNPGGLVDAATAVSSLWLPEGKMILQERRGTTAVSTELANGNNILNGMKTVVLIDGGSASASEITAGALHDNKAATVIGEKSFGKGVVQQIIPLHDDAEMKVTIASWYRPNGQNINKKGITPDQVVKLTDDDYTNNKDPQKDAAVEFLNKN
jgi:carboxyl-terminal processing protease